jgi:hypothetical protein
VRLTRGPTKLRRRWTLYSARHWRRIRKRVSATRSITMTANPRAVKSKRPKMKSMR